ncbi:MAG: TonB-dependent receptor [Mucilaginibacter sp.]|nr:TonB-dependent receptor [Mucilaginibacter sp.]
MQGKVITDNAETADGATIVLLNSRDSSVVQSTISSQTGIFNFNKLQAGSYLLFVTKLNYNKVYNGPYQVTAGNNLDIGIITIKQSANELKEVNITGKKDFVEVKADRTVLNVDQNIMASGASLYDVLSTAPGVKVMNDEILFRGGQKAMIAINGKPVLLTGEELADFLRNYQSSSISKIELIDNPGAKYDAVAAGGMINIVLKKNKDLGSNFTVSQTAAIGDKYKFNTGFTYTLRTTKLSVFASYNYINNSVPHSINTSRNIFNGNQVDNFNLNYNADIKSKNNSFNLGADYELTSRQTIGFLINGFANNANITKKSTTVISTNGQRDSSINTISGINRDIYNFNYNLNYKASLGRSGKTILSADADYSDYHRHSTELLENDFFNASGQSDSDPLFYKDVSPSHITIRSENIDFSQVLSTVTNMAAGLKNSQVNSDNMIDFDQNINGNYAILPDLTDHFVYHERINAAYLKLDTRFGKTNLSLNLRGEQTNSHAQSINAPNPVTTNYFDLFPSVQLTRNLNKNNQLTLSYARNINRPSYQDLNPFVSYIDQFYYSTGNPFLKPAYINTYSVSDFLFNKYKVLLSMVVTDNDFNTIFRQNDTTKVYITEKANLGTRYQYNAEFSVPVDITRWWHIDADLIVYHDKYVYAQDTVAKRSTSAFTFNLNQNFKLTSKLSALLHGYYESPSYFAISQYKEGYYVNAGFSYSVLNNNGRIRLVFNDIFNTDNLNRYHTNYTNLDLTARDKVGSRFIQATFTYHIGSVKSRAGKDNIEEQKRLGGGSGEN